MTWYNWFFFFFLRVGFRFRLQWIVEVNFVFLTQAKHLRQFERSTKEISCRDISQKVKYLVEGISALRVITQRALKHIVSQSVLWMVCWWCWISRQRGLLQITLMILWDHLLEVTFHKCSYSALLYWNLNFSFELYLPELSYKYPYSTVCHWHQYSYNMGAYAESNICFLTSG